MTINQGQSLLRSGKYETALNVFDKIDSGTQRLSDKYGAILGKMAALRGLGRLDEAMSEWRRATEMAPPCEVPGEIWAYYTMARLLEDLADAGWKPESCRWESLQHYAFVLVLEGDTPSHRWTSSSGLCAKLGLACTSQLLAEVAVNPNRAHAIARSLDEIQAAMASNRDALPSESLKVLQALVLCQGHLWVQATKVLGQLDNKEPRAMITAIAQIAMAFGDSFWKTDRVHAHQCWRASRDIYDSYAIALRISIASLFLGDHTQSRLFAKLAVDDLKSRSGYWKWIETTCWMLSGEEWRDGYRPILLELSNDDFTDRMGDTLASAIRNLDEHMASQ